MALQAQLGLYFSSDLLVKREVENKTETRKTDGWENQRQFFSQNF